MAALQLRLSLTAGYLSRIYKIYSKVKEKRSKATRRGLEEIDRQDKLLNILDAYKSALVQDLRVNHVPDDVDWSAFGISNNFLNASSLVESGGSSSGVVRR
jgi:hypothetical protein